MILKFLLLMAMAGTITLGPFSPSYVIEQEEEPPSPVGRTPLTDNKIYLRDRLNEEDLGDKFYIFDTIVKLESNWDEKAQSPLSSAKGLSQIIDGTWAKHECLGRVLNGRDNIDCMIKIYRSSGISAWCTDIRGYFELRRQGIWCSPDWIDERSYDYL